MTVMREMRAYRRNHRNEMGLERMYCASQFTIPKRAGTGSDLRCNYPDTRSSWPNQTSVTPDFAYALVILHIILISIPITLFLVHNSTNITERKVNSSLSISACHDHDLTPSTASAEYSIHWVQHPAKIGCLPFIIMIRSWPLNVAAASGVHPYTIDRHQSALHGRSIVKSPCHDPMVTS